VADGWERGTHVATGIIALCTIGALIVAIFSYKDAAEMNRHAAEMNRHAAVAQSHAVAVGILQDYMKMAVDHPDLASRYERHPTEDRRQWFAAHAYSSAEAIYNLTRGEAPWDSTVAGIIDAHALLVTDGQYYCHDYTPAFDSLVHRVLGKARYRCAPLQTNSK
jgi:hypothetical protein